MKRIGILISIGAIVCLCLLTACNAKNGFFSVSNHGALLNCQVWEVAFSTAGASTNPQQPIRIEKGWEPFANFNGMTIIQRCADSPKI